MPGGMIDCMINYPSLVNNFWIHFDLHSHFQGVPFVEEDESHKQGALFEDVKQAQPTLLEDSVC